MISVDRQSLGLVLIPGKFQLCQFDIHLLNYCWQRETFSWQQGEAVSHCDQTQIHHQGIMGGGGFGNDDERSLQFNVHGQAETLLGKVSNAGSCLFCSLSCRSTQSIFSSLEVVDKHLKEKIKNKPGVREAIPNQHHSNKESQRDIVKKLDMCTCEFISVS